ncbi:hypothetical protein PYCCODRAFT_1463878 [Trametes coccinea BRFM310]|uniref:Uncharacterized protein n=1 Tax=Trametes coccinea (strain BRFM310) TaxID=1353009 RepID=A0A1Y2IZY0_TRAC3|nr:hypothetical protein PYCCODRAFT_1463878 [Trametes coccinea BRFM310]
MSSNPRNYNAEDRVRWERYADAFRAWLGKRGTYPGEPPEGYLEVYKVSQRYAPCPHEYAALVAAERTPSQPSSGVTMSPEAFEALLAHQTAMTAQLASFARLNDRTPDHAGGLYRETRAYQQYAGRGTGQRGRGRGRRNQPGGRSLSERVGTHTSGHSNGRYGRSTHRGNRAGRDRHEQEPLTNNLPTGEPVISSLFDAFFAQLHLSDREGDEPQPQAQAEAEEQHDPVEEPTNDHEPEHDDGFVEHTMEVDYGSDFEDALRI